jgi:hypothetical protein
MGPTEDESHPQPDHRNPTTQDQPTIAEEHVLPNSIQRLPAAPQVGEGNLSPQRLQIDANDPSHDHPGPTAAERSSSRIIESTASGAADGSIPNNTHIPQEADVEPVQLPSNADRDPEHIERAAAISQRDGDSASTSLLTKLKCLWQRLLDYMQDSWFLEIAAL